MPHTSGATLTTEPATSTSCAPEGRRHPREPRGLHAPVRAPQLPALDPVVVGGSALGGIAYMADFSIGAGIGLTHGTGNALLGDRGRRAGHLRDRLPAGLLRRPLQPRPGPDHPRLRLRLLRLGDHQRHLRELHVHLLRARGLDHGAGPATRASVSAVAGLPGLHAGDHPAGDLRDEGADQAPDLDEPRSGCS